MAKRISTADELSGKLYAHKLLLTILMTEAARQRSRPKQFLATTSKRVTEHFDKREEGGRDDPHVIAASRAECDVVISGANVIFS